MNVLTLTPYRITLGGGGTDLPFYSDVKGGFLISAAINHFISVFAAYRPLDDKILVQTSENQFAKNVDDVHHDHVREVLKYFNIKKGVQVSIYSTLPTSIGLGSSSTCTVGLVKAVSLLAGKKLDPCQIAFIACHIERDVLGLPGGIQDQYIAALGGIQTIDVDTEGKISCNPVYIEKDELDMLEKGFVLVPTGVERSSSDIIISQTYNLKNAIEVYDKIKDIGKRSLTLLENGDVKGLGKMMDDHWQYKKSLSYRITNDAFDDMYLKLKKYGSTGGKLVGAGGGGLFMMAVPKNRDEYIKKLLNAGYRCLDWRFDFNGTHEVKL